MVDAIIGVWEALRERGETLSETVRRFGLEVCQAQIAAVFQDRWESGPEPTEAPVSEVMTGPDHRIPNVKGT
jgi:hypothetical protein